MTDSTDVNGSIGVGSILGFKHMQANNRPIFPMVGFASGSYIVNRPTNTGGWNEIF